MIRSKNARVESQLNSQKKVEPNQVESSFRIEDIEAAAPTAVAPNDNDSSLCSNDDNAKSTKRVRPRKQSRLLFFILLATIVLRLLLALRPSSSQGRPPLTMRRRRRRRNYNMLPQPGEYAPLTTTTDKTIPPLQQLLIPPTNDYHVFVLQSTTQQQQPTLLNVMMGIMLQNPNDHVAFTKYSDLLGDYETKQRNQIIWNNASVVSATDEQDLSSLQRAFRRQYQHLFFVTSSEMAECHMPPDNLLCVDSNDLYYNTESPESQEEMIHRFIARFQTAFPYFSQVQFDVQRAASRLRGMERMMIKHMKDVPSTTFETKYGIYGALV
jgi:predicted nucleic acid-binding Zn ribbon protein